MPKYTEADGSIPSTKWLKRVANELAENNRLLRKLRKDFGNTGDVLDSDEAGT